MSAIEQLQAYFETLATSVGGRGATALMLTLASINPATASATTMTMVGVGGLAISSGVVGLFKYLKGQRDSAKLSQGDQKILEGIMTSYSNVLEEIAELERQINRYDIDIASAPNESKRSLGVEAAAAANELLDMLDKLDELNIKRPVESVKTPKIGMTYDICHPEHCYELGLVERPDIIWGDNDKCCRPPPIKGIIDQLTTLEKRLDDLEVIDPLTNPSAPPPRRAPQPIHVPVEHRLDDLGGVPAPEVHMLNEEDELESRVPDANGG
jgi:hypothetical protein